MSSIHVTTEKSFVQTHLDPGTRLAEVLFGLIMVLTFTLTAGVTLREGQTVRELLRATLGCNFAWGIIDGVMYIMNQVFLRSRRTRFILLLKNHPDEDVALAAIAEELDDTLAPITHAAQRERFYREILWELSLARPRQTRLEKADLLGAVASFWLVFLSTIPAAIPFLFIANPWVALRVSNLLLIGLLFFVGILWARHTQTSPWGAGLSLVALGLVLVGVAIALGG
jgi:hypothetical protein